MTKFLNISTDNTLGGNSPSDEIVSSQKAIKYYVDNAGIGANKSLSNLDSTGQNITNWSTNVTNCIVEIPQDIKLTLANGTITLKKDSKLYKPNGSGVFDTYTLSADKTYTTSANGTYMLFLTSSNVFDIVGVNNVYSGDTAPTGISQYSLWYDTANNLIRKTNDGGTTWSNSAISFPICIFTVSNGAISSIDQVFNGFGYIGSHVFILPGVKGLIPDGRNTDGTLKNITGVISAVKTQDMSPVISNNRIIALSGAGNINRYQTLETNNDNYNVANGSTIVQAVGFCKAYTNSNGKIISFIQKTTFHAVDYSDFTEELDKKADTVNTANTDLSNLTSTGANITNWSSSVSNCIVDIPQDILLSLSGTTLTLKAGSKVYQPNGGSTTIASDIVVEDYSSASSGQYMLFYSETYKTAGYSGIFAISVSDCVSGTSDSSSAPTHAWYDASNWLIKRYFNGSYNPTDLSWPLGVVSIKNGTGFTSITNVFNGFGFIGLTTFVLPGVKALVPEGLNEDGTLKSSLAERKNSVSVITFPDNNARTFALRKGVNAGMGGYFGKPFSQEDYPGNNYKRWYKPSENKVYNSGTGQGAQTQTFDSWLFYYNPTTYEFISNKVFTPVDYSEYALTKSNVENKANLNLLNTSNNVDFVVERQEPTSSNNYMWYRKYRSGWVEQGGIGATNDAAIILPVPMADTNYTASAPGITSYGTVSAMGPDATAVTKTTTTVKYGNTTVFGLTFDWMVCGMAA